MQKVVQPWAVAYTRRSVGLRQAPRAWHMRLKELLLAMGFKPSAADPSLSSATGESGTIYLLIYVDNILIAVRSTTDAQKLEAELRTKFNTHELGQAALFLNIAAESNHSKGQIKIHQRQLTAQLSHMAC